MGQKRKEEEGKQIADMLCVAACRLEDLPCAVKKAGPPDPLRRPLEAESMANPKKIGAIDTIVNSASPDLMGSKNEKTIDNVLHDIIDQKLKEKNPGDTFNKMICKELDPGKSSELSEDEECISRIRCPRGKAVLTGGYGFCDYVIHAVGTKLQQIEDPGRIRRAVHEKFRFCKKFYKKKKSEKICASSSIQTLESCYYEIVRLIRQYPDIRNAAVPIIGSGNYGVDFRMAARIAVSAVGNALMQWKQSDEESFNTSKLENIIFFVRPETEDCPAASDGKAAKNEQLDTIKEIFAEYREIYQQNHQVVFQDSFTAQRQYYNEIILNDEKRGYFAIARCFRCVLVWCRMFLGLLSNKIKDMAGGNDWQKRRRAVEGITVVKILFPVAGLLLARYCPYIGGIPVVHAVSFILFYSMADTVTYLLALLMMADIQKPSANIIRSLLLLFFNYMEVSWGMAYFYYVYGTGVTFKRALALGGLGEGTDTAVMSAIPDMIIGYADAGLKFFFLTVVFGYLVQHMRQRKFRGEKSF